MKYEELATGLYKETDVDLLGRTINIDKLEYTGNQVHVTYTWIDVPGDTHKGIVGTTSRMSGDRGEDLALHPCVHIIEEVPV